jgi:hypothetical protein
MFMRIRALIALWTGSYKDALSKGKRLGDASAARTPVNWSDLVTSYYIIANSHDNLGQKSDAYATADKALKLQLPDAYKNMPHIKEHLKNLNGIHSKNKP